MSAIILKILSIIGIFLLVLLGVVLLILLLVLFFPVSYRLKGSKDAERMCIRARVYWLFGLLRIRFDYPEPGRLIAKMLCFTVYDSGAEKKEKTSNKKTASRAKRGSAPKKEQEDKTQTLSKQEPVPKEDAAEQDQTSAEDTASSQEQPSGIKDRIFAKYEKIKYTILKIYDKIKEIPDHIAYYRELLEEDDTKELLRHAGMRIGKILKNIRPRKLDVNILFGAYSPDSTGYLYAVYGMIYPTLGKYVLLTPDFTRAVLEGNVDMAGHITLFMVLWNGAMLVLDKRLRILVKKIKAYNKQCGNGV